MNRDYIQYLNLTIIMIMKRNERGNKGKVIGEGKCKKKTHTLGLISQYINPESLSFLFVFITAGSSASHLFIPLLLVSVLSSFFLGFFQIRLCAEEEGEFLAVYVSVLRPDLLGWRNPWNSKSSPMASVSQKTTSPSSSSCSATNAAAAIPRLAAAPSPAPATAAAVPQDWTAAVTDVPRISSTNASAAKGTLPNISLLSLPLSFTLLSIAYKFNYLFRAILIQSFIFLLQISNFSPSFVFTNSFLVFTHKTIKIKWGNEHLKQLSTNKSLDWVLLDSVALSKASVERCGCKEPKVAS